MQKNITIGNKYDWVMEIQTQEEADKYFEECILHMMSFGKTREEAEEIERQNLGYFAGYYDHETRLRVEKLFKCKHPLFGKASEHIPTPKEAIQMGMSLGKRKISE